MRVTRAGPRPGSASNRARLAVLRLRREVRRDVLGWCDVLGVGVGTTGEGVAGVGV